MKNQALANQLVKMMEQGRAPMVGEMMDELLLALNTEKNIEKCHYPFVNESHTKMFPAVMEDGYIGEPTGDNVSYWLIVDKQDDKFVTKFIAEAQGSLKDLVTEPLDRQFFEDLFWMLPKNCQKYDLQQWHRDLVESGKIAGFVSY